MERRNKNNNRTSQGQGLKTLGLSASTGRLRSPDGSKKERRNDSEWIGLQYGKSKD